MAIMDNTKKYNPNLSTNLRIKPELKALLAQEALDTETSMSEIINEILKARYSVK